MFQTTRWFFSYKRNYHHNGNQSGKWHSTSTTTINKQTNKQKSFKNPRQNEERKQKHFWKL